MQVDTMVKILVCPVCKGALDPTREGDGLMCHVCNLNFPIRDGIPVMKPNEASSIVNH